jgi:FKBP-type peptidyl-prolyl cis-trans isomerase SlpA
MSKIENGKSVKLHYTGKFENEEVFDSSLEREPLEFTVGTGQLIPGFENGVIGLEVGDKKTLEIEPTEGYGELRNDLIQEVSLTQLPEGVSVGDRLEGVAENGMPIAVVVREISDGVALVDANHPLAGRKLIFEIEIVEVA